MATTPHRMDRRSFLAASTAVALTTATGNAAEEKPVNLLFIMTDQQRFDALSCAGSQFVDTPNLDRLAVEGTRFEAAWCPSTVCAPSRTSILTGEPVHRHDCVGNPQAHKDVLREGLDSYDATLRAAGYATDYRGRWHAPPQLLAYDKPPWINQVGKDYKKHLNKSVGKAPKPAEGQYLNGMSGWPYTPDKIDHNYRDSVLNDPAPNEKGGTMYGKDAVPSTHTLSAVVADETIASLKRMKDIPFALSSSYLHPHHPLYVSEKYLDAVKPADMLPSPSFNNPPKNTCYDKGYSWVFDAMERDHIALIMARYYSLVKEVDDQVGRVLDTLDELGLAENTLVVFTSDHGEMLGDHGLHQKFVTYEGSVRVPLLLRLPGRIPAGKVIKTPVSLIDLHATILDYLGQPAVPRTSTSLRPLIEGHTKTTALPVTSQFGGWTLATRDEQWKYVWSRRPDDPDMLYDLYADPHENTNLLGTNPDRANYVAEGKRMKEMLCAWMQETEHPWLEIATNTALR